MSAKTSGRLILVAHKTIVKITVAEYNNRETKWHSIVSRISLIGCRYSRRKIVPNSAASCATGVARGTYAWSPCMVSSTYLSTPKPPDAAEVFYQQRCGSGTHSESFLAKRGEAGPLLVSCAWSGCEMFASVNGMVWLPWSETHPQASTFIHL